MSGRRVYGSSCQIGAYIAVRVTYESSKHGSSLQVEEHACMHAWQFVPGRKNKVILDGIMRGFRSKQDSYKKCQVRIEAIAVPTV
jgi:hypothetical protein